MKFYFSLDQSKSISALLWREIGRLEEQMKGDERVKDPKIRDICENGIAEMRMLQGYIDSEIRKEDPNV